MLDALVAGGADVIELGMPFTDPMADGPAIQAANIRSLAAGTTTADILAIARDFRARHADVPVVLMGYGNPMLRRGPAWFAREAAAAGVDGVDPRSTCRPRRTRHSARRCDPRGSTSSASPPPPPTPCGCRACWRASGFLYYVSVAGITGKQQAQQASIEEAVARLKAATDIPVAVGFGVRTPEQAAAIARVADGVVVGSAIVEIVAEHGADAPTPVTAYLRSLKDAIASTPKEPA
ncbi:tryptophan synthase subunit alpha [Sphingomonas sp. MMS24-JH45]